MRCRYIENSPGLRGNMALTPTEVPGRVSWRRQTLRWRMAVVSELNLNPWQSEMYTVHLYCLLNSLHFTGERYPKQVSRGRRSFEAGDYWNPLLSWLPPSILLPQPLLLVLLYGFLCVQPLTIAVPLFFTRGISFCLLPFSPHTLGVWPPLLIWLQFPSIFW